MRIIKLMADYECWPLWEASPGMVGNINPADLPISRTLIADLNQWSEHFTATMNRNNPAISGFASEKEEAKFQEDQTHLAERLKAELGPNFKIVTQ